MSDPRQVAIARLSVALDLLLTVRDLIVDEDQGRSLDAQELNSIAVDLRNFASKRFDTLLAEAEEVS